MLLTKYKALRALIFILLLHSGVLTPRTYAQKPTLVKFLDSAESCGYHDLNNNIVIPAGKYSMCFTDTFLYYGIVFSNSEGLIAVDQNDQLLFHVFSYDNGPDPLSGGLFRIIKDEKIGYANSKAEIIVEPQYECAYPFKNNKAKVSYQCQTKMDGEYSSWTSQNWIYIDKEGNLVK